MKPPGTDARHNFIHETAEIADDVEIGDYNFFGPSVVVGSGCKFGRFNLLEASVVIGEGTEVKSRVELRHGTVIGKRCLIDSGVKSSGNNRVGDGVTLRYDVIIARGCVIGSGSYLSPQVMMNNVDHKYDEVGGANVGDNCFIGTQTVLAAGISIATRTITGGCSNVTKSIGEPGIYFGNPAKYRGPLREVRGDASGSEEDK